MHFEILLAALFAAAGTAAAADVVSAVRTAVAHGDFAGAEAGLRAYRTERGQTPEWLEAFSWLGRGALAAGSLDKADQWAAEIHRLALGMLQGRALDTEPHLPIALGAAIEVHAQVLDARGGRGEAVRYLREELARYRDTSIRTRIQKNIHLLSLEGKPAPPLDIERWVGVRPPSLGSLEGRPVLLFFWAHWCGDCKGEVPELVKLRARFSELALMAPTQWYGYVAGGKEVPEAQETAYIEQVWKRYYAVLGAVPVPVGGQNFRGYGASTVPTLVLLDSQGRVRMYHPGAVPFSELETRVNALNASTTKP